MEITYKDLATIFNMSESDVKRYLSWYGINEFCLEYDEIEDQNEIINQINNELDQSAFKNNYVDKWNDGWGEIYEKFKKSGNFDDLKPQYMKYNLFRWNGKYIRMGIAQTPERRSPKPKVEGSNPSAHANFEDKFQQAIVALSCIDFSKNKKPIVEFGCGTGRNLILLSKLFRDRELLGCDWSEYSQKILELVNLKGYSIEPIKYDMFNPVTHYRGYDIELDIQNFNVLTCHSMEQLGENFRPFVDFLIKMKCNVICIEPLVELYQESEFDLVAKRYHKQREYLDGLLGYLLKKKVKLDVTEVQFGSKYHNAYHIIRWCQK